MGFGQQQQGTMKEVAFLFVFDFEFKRPRLTAS